MIGLKQSFAWKLARGWKRRLVPASMTQPLPADACHAAVEWLNPPPVLEAGQAFTVRLRVTNLSGVPWSSAGPWPVVLRSEWLTNTGQVFADGPTQSWPLPQVLYPGEPAIIKLRFKAPAFVGDFTLRCDLAQQELFSKQNTDSRAVLTAVAVTGPRATDIDYHAVYRTANLQENHWWVVGAYPTREAFERSSRERLHMLMQQGLRPEAHVLDVGCGTGQMAGVLESYLNEAGAYYGTDIGRESIDFCRSRYRRGNFHFAQGGMTTLPFARSIQCDYALFFSVFTHVFTDEAALLLSETAQLLKPTGVILADIITSDLVDRCAGHRGEMIVNRDHFLRLARFAGFRAFPLGTWKWNPHAERIMFRFERS